MKIGIFSDIHIHKFLRFSRNGGIDRLNYGLKVLEAVFLTFIEQQCEAVFFLGDFFHTRKTVDVQTLSAVYRFMKKFTEEHHEDWEKLTQTAVMIPGNHDSYLGVIRFEDEIPGELSIEMMQEFGFSVIYRPGPIRVKDNYLTICLVPWARQEEQIKAIHAMSLAKYSPRKRDYKVLMMHGIPQGFSSPSGKVFDNGIPLDVLGEFHTVFCGDVHKMQRIRNVIMVGSPMQHDFGDMLQERGCWTFDTETRIPTFHRIKGIAPEFFACGDQNRLDDFNYFRYSGPPIDLRWNVVSTHIPVDSDQSVSVSVIRDGMSIESIINVYVEAYGDGYDRDTLRKLGLELLGASS